MIRSLRFAMLFTVCCLWGPAMLVLEMEPPAVTAAESDNTPPKTVRPEQLPRIPPTEPQDALKTFRVAKGFRLELVAHEPDVIDPIDACFDENGRLYVVEMRDYPYHKEPHPREPESIKPEHTGRIRLLEDTNGDGRFDRSVVFADNISFPQSVCCYNGGVFVIAPPHVYYLKDTDGDHRADVREIVYSGFSRQNQQSMANGLKWGLDNHIYAAGGRSGAELTHRGKKLFSLGRRDFRFDPKTETLEPVSGGLQFGHSFDDWGNRFVCSNSNHMLHVVFPYRYLKRNPAVAVSDVVRSIAKEGGAARVYRLSPPEPWRILRQIWRAAEKGYKLIREQDGNWRFVPLDPSKAKATNGPPTEYPVGYFTSATGVTIYRGDAYPPQFRGNAFIGDVGGNLIHRKTVQPNGVSFLAVRADEGREFVASTDNWFRPVNFVNGPDGTLYVLDMYRETIEHPWSIPPEMKQYLDLQSGNDRGRIYRLVPSGWQYQPPPKLGEMSAPELVAQLESDNAWNRETAQRLLWEREDSSAVPLLKRLFESSASPLARLHALWTLRGLNALPVKLIAAALKDPHPRVREHAVRLAELHLNSAPELLAQLLTLCDDPDLRVQFQLAFSLGEADGEQAVKDLAQLGRRVSDKEDLRTALLTSAAGRADKIAIKLLDDPAFVKQRGGSTLLAELAQLAGAEKNPGPSLRLLGAVAQPDRSLAIQQLVLGALGEGLDRRGSTVAELLAGSSADEPLRRQVTGVFQRAIEILRDADRPLSARIQAVELLASADFGTASKPLSALLSPQAPQQLQVAAVRALSRQRSSKVSDILTAGWRSDSPQVRREVVDALLLRVSRIDTLLTAVESSAIPPGEIERDKKQLLMNHPNAEVRARSRKLFGGEVSSDRAGVVADYQKALDLDGDPQRGREIFKEHCSLCHRVGDLGHPVAPDLASTQNKSADDFLIAILDPNREAQPNYTTYTVVTNGGRIYNGIIAAETEANLTLRRAEGKEDVILRSNVATLVSSGKSLMPDGLEKEITPQQMADLIAFIQTIKPQELRRNAQ